MMATSPSPSCSCCTGTSFQVAARPYNSSPLCSPTRSAISMRHGLVLKGAESGTQGCDAAGVGNKVLSSWSFVDWWRIVLGRRDQQRRPHARKIFQPSASWTQISQLAGGAISTGTLAVLPFYCLMIFTPKAEHTKRIMANCTPHLILGALYAYLFYLAWTPDTIKLLFAENGLPKMAGIIKLFSDEMTLASAWIHFLVVDLFAARQIFHDGLQNDMETRHSIIFCLLSCPLGIVIHAITKFIYKHRG